MAKTLRPSATVVVATFGDFSWAELARERAIPSAERLGVPAIHSHAKTFASALNEGLDQVETEWVVHLDADDSLDPGYIDAMGRGMADIRAPMLRYIEPIRERTWHPHVAGHKHRCHRACLRYGNWVAQGAYARVSTIREAGGWREWERLHDWELWLRCWKIGASFELIEDAIYIADFREGSMNNSLNEKETYESIRKEHWWAKIPKYPES